MRSRRVLLLNILIVVGLILSELAVGVPLAGVTSQTGAAPQVGSAGSAEPVLASKRAKVKQDRRQDRRKDAEQDRKKNGKQADGKQDRKKNSAYEASLREAINREASLPEPRVSDPSLPQASMEGEIALGDASSKECASNQSMQEHQIDLCTHGPDEPPPGFSIDEPVPLLSKKAATKQVSAAAIACLGEDGLAGNRIRVLYVRASDRPDNYAASVPTIQAILAEMDVIFRRNSANTGGPYRSIRFWQDPTTCLPWVTEVVVSPTGDDNMTATVNEVKAGGLNGADRMTRTDRMYLMFVDATVLCGIGSVWTDDRVGAENWNNTGPAYARVDRGCWGAQTATHEVVHNLGGVQNSAPNSSNGLHCIDEWDIMCYSDVDQVNNIPPMRIDCVNGALNRTGLDCNYNDYFNMNPPAGSYLATHWNTANNQFLGAAFAPPPEPPVVTPPPPEDDTWNGGKKKKKKKKKKKRR